MEARRYMVRLLAAVALLASVSWASAQEDSTRVRRDSIRLQIGDVEPMMPMGSSVVSPADHYGRTPQLGDRSMTMPPVQPRVGDIPPYYTNPSPMFRGDYSTGGVLGMGRKFVFTGSGSQTSIPGIGRLNNASVGYSYALNDKLSLQASVDAVKIGMMHFSGQSFTAGGTLLYRPQEHLWFTAFGSVGAGNAMGMFSYPYQYGGTMGFDIGERFSLEMGVRRFYNNATGRWEMLPIVIPTIKFSEKFQLGFDVGPLIYEVLRDVLFDQKSRNSGPTIRPDVPGYMGNAFR